MQEFILSVGQIDIIILLIGIINEPLVVRVRWRNLSFEL